ERSSEILFALIMVLSFTCSISVATAASSAEAREEVKEVLIGAIGCNLAWGIIDAVMYLMMIRIERGRDFTLGKSVRGGKDPAAGRALLADALPDDMNGLFDADALERARAKLVQRPSAPSPRLTGRDWKGAFGVFLLVFVSTFPVVVPFLF